MSNVAAAPTTIDLSRASAPDAIEALDVEVMYDEFQARFLAAWEVERTKNPALPVYTVADLETDTVAIVGEALTFLRYLDRIRVNDAVKAVLAPLARGNNLDAVVARMGVTRKITAPANSQTGAAAVYETDAQLLRRYLLEFDRPSAGSAGAYLAAAFAAWPAMQDAAVRGYAVHKRRGDVDVLVVGPEGRAPTPEELATVRAAVLAPDRVSEAVSVSVRAATRLEYSVDVSVFVPPGPDAQVVGREVAARIRAATDDRTLIGAEVPLSAIEGAAYGPNVVRARVNVPDDPKYIRASIPSDPYTVPVCVGITVRLEASI